MGRKKYHGCLPDSKSMYKLHKTMSMKTIGEMYGCTRQAVSQWFQLHGGKATDHRKITNAELICDCLNKGMDLNETAKLTGHYTNTVRDVAKRFDIVLPCKPIPTWQTKLANKQWIVKRYKEWYWTIDHIATVLHCSSGVVRDWMIRHRINARTKGRPLNGTPLPKNLPKSVVVRRKK